MLGQWGTLQGNTEMTPCPTSHPKISPRRTVNLSMQDERDNAGDTGSDALGKQTCEEGEGQAHGQEDANGKSRRGCAGQGAHRTRGL